MKTSAPNPTAGNRKTALKMVSLLGLILTVVPAVLVFAGVLTWDVHAILMAIGAVLWFGTAPFWMSR